MDYAAAKSTICRQCGRHFSPSAPKPGLQIRSKDEVIAAAAETSGSVPRPSFWGRGKNRLVACFECKRRHEVSEAATSTNCPGCSAHIDLRDYKITTSFSRSIRTRGTLHLTSKGDLSSTSVVCRSAILEGKLRGNVQCEESATINFTGKIPGRLSANYLKVERKADVQCYRRVVCGSIDIIGRLSGEIVATGAVNIHKTGVLEGNVTAKSIAIEKGGVFSGALVIGQANLEQGELLPDPAKAEATPVEQPPVEKVEAPVAHPLPAT